MATTATDYGADALALLDLPEVEIMGTGDIVVAYAIGRRWLTPSGALEEIGDTEPYDSIDVREWLGRRFKVGDRSVLDDLQTQAAQVALGDLRVRSITVAATFTAGVLTLRGAGQGAKGPFSLVLSVDGLSAQILRGG